MDYRYLKTFSKRSKLDKSTYDGVVARWHEFGLGGEPPKVTVFEDAEELPQETVGVPDTM